MTWGSTPVLVVRDFVRNELSTGHKLRIRLGCRYWTLVVPGRLPLASQDRCRTACQPDPMAGPDWKFRAQIVLLFPA